MRLINCETLKLEEFIGLDIPDYAILSHTWGKNEVTFADVRDGDVETVASRKSFQKTAYTCKQALKDGLKYAWIDTLCIDKASSAELSESINSMFSWYKHAARCYVYLSDISFKTTDTSVTSSRWFTRGWTLQELIAPSNLSFYDCDWSWLGTRQDYAHSIAKATSIDMGVLRYGIYRQSNSKTRHKTIIPLSNFSVAQKMSWAAGRHTTREEDVAYSLMGLFGVNMPLLYGEGKRAFQRLQREIMTNVADDSILAWGLCPPFTMSPGYQRYHFVPTRQGFLATSPSDFQGCENITLQSRRISSFEMTNNGLKIRLHITDPEAYNSVRSESSSGTNISNSDAVDMTTICIGILNCSLNKAPPTSEDEKPGMKLDSHIIGLLLMQPDAMAEPFVRCGLRGDDFFLQTMRIDPRLAIKATVREILISQEAKVASSTEKHSKYRYMIKISRALPDISCVGGVVISMYGQDACITKWSSRWQMETSTLSFGFTDPRIIGYVLFTFHPAFPSDVFPSDVFMVLVNLQYNRGIIIKGSDDCHSHIATLCSRLRNNIHSEGTNELQSIVVSNSWLGDCPITFKIKSNRIYDWRLYELKITIDSSHGTSLANSLRVSQRPSPEILPSSMSNHTNPEEHQDAIHDHQV